jgi:hypothetical protein
MLGMEIENWMMAGAIDVWEALDITISNSAGRRASIYVRSSIDRVIVHSTKDPALHDILGIP